MTKHDVYVGQLYTRIDIWRGWELERTVYVHSSEYRANA